VRDSKTNAILQALISLPIYSFYAHRMRILGAHSWVCVIVLILGLAHFTLKMAFCIKVLIGGHVSILAAPDTMVRDVASLVFTAAY
jgi:hypothetical protein